uniref:Uncharacterized protein n=1 Tax=Mola mola TaxID=94237 RepID=A0A3Q3XEX1_MOLML
MNEGNERERRVEEEETVEQEVGEISKDEVREALKRMKNGKLATPPRTSAPVSARLLSWLLPPPSHQVMKEIQSAMATAASDDSKMVLLGAVGSVFCCGLDFLYFIRRLTDDRKKESIKMAETIRTFVNTFIQFRKPIVAAVNGPAVGLGAAILPLCDVVWANEKAWFQTPYTAYGQTPDACSSFTFPRIMGLASANELLLSGRKLTAQEACSKGLVSQVLWPGTFTQEVMVRIKELVTVDSLVLRESKALMRNTSRSALEQANERECESLKRVWGSSQGTDSILQYLQRRTELC